jgi:hypothetical protein
LVITVAHCGFLDAVKILKDCINPK